MNVETIIKIISIILLFITNIVILLCLIHSFFVSIVKQGIIKANDVLNEKDKEKIDK